ncbi:MAG TPA: cyclic nucleotide-binding domain-containing protein [Sediminispirochaeta sp.]|nr:cyclic nucleotide-binding domain-containing protein [Sediminispirochaeta sp.]
MYTDNNPEKYREKINTIILFKFLSAREIEDLLAMCEVQVFEPEETIVNQGDVEQAFYAIIEGNVEVDVDEKRRKNVYICTIGAGEVFGEAGMFMKVQRTANVKSLDNSVMLKMTREKFIQFIKKYPATGNKILMVIVYSLLKKLREANQELAYERKFDISQDDVDSIVSDFIG